MNHQVAPDAMHLLLGARTSPLAVAQAEQVAETIRALGHTVDLVGLSTKGDTDRRSLTEIGGTGVFATAVREALLRCEVDVVVHSLKDLPVAPAPGIALAAIPPREQVNDVLVGLPPQQWGPGLVVGCGSPRRIAQVAALFDRVVGRSDDDSAQCDAPAALRVLPIRGNVDTRIAQVADGTFDVTVLARAGLARLGKVPSSGRLPDQVNGVPVTELSLEQMLPAPGQAALAVECRSDDAAVRSVLSALDDAATRAAVTAERAFLGRLEAGCLAPVGAFAEVVGTRLRLDAVVQQGDQLLRFGARGRPDQAESLGQTLAESALAGLDEAVNGRVG